MSEEKAERSEAGQKVRWESKTENDGKKGLVCVVGGE